MSNGLRFKDVKSMPDGLRQLTERAIARDAGSAGGRKRQREVKQLDQSPPFYGIDFAKGPDATVVTVWLSTRSGRGQNSRGHWSKTAKRAKAEHELAHTAVIAAFRGFRPTSATVTLTRCAPGRGLDDDNLVGSMKAFRDGVASAIGIDDADHRVKYQYAQQKAGRANWGVRIEMHCPTTEEQDS